MSDIDPPHPVRATLLTALRAQPELWAYLMARLTGQIATHMFAVIIGWQVYELTGDIFALGIVGLVRFLPAMPLFPLAGYAADRYRRLAVYGIAVAAQILAAMVLFVNALLPAPSVVVIYGTLLIFEAGRAFSNTAGRTIIGSVAVREYLPSAVALHSIVARSAALLGPVLGGVLIGLTGGLAYAVIAGFFAGSLLWLVRIRSLPPANSNRSLSLGNLLGGLHYVRSNRAILGTILVDLVAVVGGTVLGLLPVIAKDILEVGPEGLGLLRSMPSFGAILVALLLGQRLPVRATGWLLFGGLAVHGGAILVFGLSTSFGLSAALLALYGGTDMVGVWIRQTVIQLATPNAMLGLVSAVEIACSNGSEELGSFRSGIVAAAVGAPLAVVIGGLTALSVTLVGAIALPEIRRLQNLGAMEVSRRRKPNNPP